MHFSAFSEQRCDNCKCRYEMNKIANIWLSLVLFSKRQGIDKKPKISSQRQREKSLWNSHLESVGDSSYFQVFKHLQIWQTSAISCFFSADGGFKFASMHLNNNNWFFHINILDKGKWISLYFYRIVCFLREIFLRSVFPRFSA